MHFKYNGNAENLEKFTNENKHRLIEATDRITEKMRERGGGISKIQLINRSTELNSEYPLHLAFKTKESMAANFIYSS